MLKESFSLLEKRVLNYFNVERIPTESSESFTIFGGFGNKN